MYTLFNADTDLWKPEWDTMPANLAKAGLAFLIVLGVMALLVGLVYLFRVILKIKIKRKKKGGASDTKLGAEEDEELTAAITAAVYAYLAEEAKDEAEEVPPFVIRKISGK